MNIVFVVDIQRTSYIRAAVEEYTKRLSRYCRTTVIPQEKKGVREKDYLVEVTSGGEPLSSTQLAALISSLMVKGTSSIAFVLAAPDDTVERQADFRLSLSRMEIDTGIALVMIMEQVYRAFKINNNETYHK